MSLKSDMMSEVLTGIIATRPSRFNLRSYRLGPIRQGSLLLAALDSFDVYLTKTVIRAGKLVSKLKLDCFLLTWPSLRRTTRT